MADLVNIETGKKLRRTECVPEWILFKCKKTQTIVTGVRMKLSWLALLLTGKVHE